MEIAGTAEPTGAVTAQNVAVLLGMSLFFGLAFENWFAGRLPDRPGGIRTFPLLAIAGASAYLLAPHSGLVLAAGLAVLGLWLLSYQRGPTPLDYIIPLCNVVAYLLGAIAITQPPWVTVALTVAATMLLAGRQRLHTFALDLPPGEIITGAQFLLLVGVGLPLLPDEPLLGLGALTPHRILLAVVAVSTLSYASYLLTRYVRPRGATLLAAVLGGLYSSTATTVVLARRSKAGDGDVGTGIVLATAFMYVRMLAIITIFNAALASVLAAPLLALSGLAALCAGLLRVYEREAPTKTALDAPGNPLNIGTAVVFAGMFAIVTVATHAAQGRFGRLGLDGLAAIVGITDIDPFVLSVAQNPGTAMNDVGGAILIAASSNNVLKAIYALSFGSVQAVLRPTIVLLGVAAASGVAAVLISR